jgi:hypothetical protein
MRRCIALGALLVLGMSPLLVQCQDEPRYEEQNSETGQLSLPLEAFGRSGNVYRLREAVFLVERRIAAAGDGSGGAGGASFTSIGNGIVASASGVGGGIATGGGDAVGSGTGGGVATGGSGGSGGSSDSGDSVGGDVG